MSGCTWQICCVCTDGRVISALTGVTVPESAQRWANQIRQEGEVLSKDYVPPGFAGSYMA